MRLPTLLVALALPAALLAGCTAPEDTPSDDTTPQPGPGPGPGGSDPPPQDQPESVDAAPVDDSGDIVGPFQKAWELEVATIAFREAHVTFALAGAQAGAPPTASVQFSLLDPDGKVVKTALVGLGGEGDSLEWTLRAADLPSAGTYVLEAASTPTATAPGVPAAPGLAKYTLHAEVVY